VSKHVISYMKDFLFSAEQARTPLASCPAGNAAADAAQALAKPSNS